MVKEFIPEVYLPWAKRNKKSYRNDAYRVKPLEAFFGRMRIRDISPFLVEEVQTRAIEYTDHLSAQDQGEVCSLSESGAVLAF